MPTEELGATAYRKYDIEAWMPGLKRYGEVYHFFLFNSDYHYCYYRLRVHPTALIIKAKD